MKRVLRSSLCLLLALLLALPTLAFGEGRVINLIADPEAEYSLDPEAPLLEVIFPNIYSTDSCIIRVEEQVMMIDGSKDDQARNRVNPCLAYLGIDHVDVALNTHPHYDHMTGFIDVMKQAHIDRMLIGGSENVNWVVKQAVHRLREDGTVVERVHDGDVITFGPVTMTMIQRLHTDYPINDTSVMTMIRYRDCSLFMTGDIENRAQRALYTEPPEIDLKCDILKYPHHGHVAIDQTLYGILEPELVIVTAHEYPARRGFAFLKRYDTPALSTWYGAIRCRCDGNVWLVDYLYETPGIKR